MPAQHEAITKILAGGEGRSLRPPTRCLQRTQRPAGPDARQLLGFVRLTVYHGTPGLD